MKKLHQLFFSLLLLFIFVELIFLFPQQIERHDVELVQSDDQFKKENAEQRMGEVHLVETKKGSRDWELFAQKAKGYQGKGDWFLDQVKVHFYNLEKNDYTVSGTEGEIDGKTKNIKIKGNVVTKSANGYIFYTDEIFYNATLRKIISPGKIKMKGPEDSNGDGLSLVGYNMHVLVDENEMKVFKDVHAEKKIAANSKMLISSESSTFSGGTLEAKFEGNVILDYLNMFIRGPECLLHYSKELKTFESLHVKGGVQIQDKKRNATAEDLFLSIKDSSIRLTGHPKIIEQDDEITGEEILMLDAGKKIKIQKVKASTNQN